MEKRGIEVQITGDYAMFTTPPSKVSGDKRSYCLPTYEAMVGILNSIYKKPTFRWHIDRIRVMNPIQFESRGVRHLRLDGGADMANYTYLKDVCYQVRAHMEWDLSFPELAEDRNYGKHYSIAKRAIKSGGRMNVYLGTSDCQAHVEACDFDAGEKKSVFSNTGRLPFGIMFHSFTYPEHMTARERLQLGNEPYVRISYADTYLDNGIIEYIIQDDKSFARLSFYEHKKYEAGKNMTPAQEEAV